MRPEQNCDSFGSLISLLGRYKAAIDVCDEGLSAAEKWHAEPATYVARHALTVRQLRTGKLANAPKAPRRQFTEAQKAADKAIVRKLYLRKGRAQAALCLEHLENEGPGLSPQVRNVTKKLYSGAKQSESCCSVTWFELRLTTSSTAQAMNHAISSTRAIPPHSAKSWSSADRTRLPSNASRRRQPRPSWTSTEPVAQLAFFLLFTIRYLLYTAPSSSCHCYRHPPGYLHRQSI